MNPTKILRPKWFLLALAIGVWAQVGTVSAATRRPVWAGRFYPADRAALVETIEYYTRLAQQTVLDLPQGKRLKALILPHAGYIYSGFTAAHAARVLATPNGSGDPFRKIILMGPDHRVGFRNAMVSATNAYQTPLGRVMLHPDAERLRRQTELFGSSPASDRSEHSLEVVLPFLQHYLGKFELVPVVLGSGPVRRLARSIEEIVAADTLVVASSDLSHFLPYEAAEAKDRQTIAHIVNLDLDELGRCENCACGIMPIKVLTEMARRLNWQPVQLHYQNSGDSGAGRQSVVGYAALAYYATEPGTTASVKGDEMDENETVNRPFSPQQGQVLVKLARKTLTQRLTPDEVGDQTQPLSQDLDADCYRKRYGTFVTLKIAGQLRGCIGNLIADDSVAESVRHNALNAAFHDPRFRELTAAELDEVEIEVSVLSEPQPLDYTDADDLLAKLSINVDGVVIRKGGRSATFLPQVWEQLPRKEDFLRHLCLKAGLSGTAWRDDGLEVKTYQVQYFDEEH